LVGDEVFLRGIRQGVDSGDYVYQSGDLIWAQGQPQATIKIDEQSFVYTASYARDQGIWPKPEPTPAPGEQEPEEPETPGPQGGQGETTGGTHTPGGGFGAGPQEGFTTSSTADMTAEGPLKEALNELWDKARSRKVNKVGRLYLKLFDPNDGFRVLGLAGGIPKAAKSARISGAYETSDGATLELSFEGPSEDAAPVKDFLEPQLRAAKEKDVEVAVTLTFSDGLDLSGREPDKITERLGKFGGGAAYVTATAAAADTRGDAA
jgi:hypothetical protein